MTTNIADLKQPAKQDISTMRPKDQIAHLLQQKRGEIAKMLPKHINADRLLKVAQIAATTTPALLECDVASLVGAIAQCAQMGLEPNTVLGHAYLVPFNARRGERWINSVQVIVGYKGLIDLARRSGQIISISAHEVCERDSFELVYGLEEKLAHTPAMGERGEIIGFYAVAKLVGGGHAFEFMSSRQVRQVRDNSQGWQKAVKLKKTETHPWSMHFVEMGRKTVIRRLAKYLPLSIEFQTAVAVDILAAEGKDQHMDAFDGDFSIVPESYEEDGPPSISDETVGESVPQAQESEVVKQQPQSGKAVRDGNLE